jgi:hypothetical protein
MSLNIDLIRRWIKFNRFFALISIYFNELIILLDKNDIINSKSMLISKIKYYLLSNRTNLKKIRFENLDLNKFNKKSLI